MPFLQWFTIHGVVACLGLMIYALDSHHHQKRRHPSAAIAWFCSMVLLPFLAIPLYLLFGNRKQITEPEKTKTTKNASPNKTGEKKNFSREVALSLGLFDALPVEKFNIHHNGEEARLALFDGIERAQKTITICSFLISNDPMGRDLIEKLIHKAREGVKVRVLIDAIGYYFGKCPDLKKLQNNNIEVELFAPLMKISLKGRTNLRNHRKVVVVDKQWIWTGGRNLGAQYFNIKDHKSKQRDWVDLSFDLEGPLARLGEELFNKDWAFTKGLHHVVSEEQKKFNIHQYAAQMIPSGPDQPEDTIYTMLLSTVYNASRTIELATPYFIPDQSLLNALKIAAKRGVKVELLIPEKSNYFLADVARRSSLEELHESGAHIWLHPDMMHAKAAIFDEQMAMVGSANLDERSLFLNYELMTAFYQSSEINEFKDWMAQRRSEAKAYQPQKVGMLKEITDSLIKWIAFQL